MEKMEVNVHVKGLLSLCYGCKKKVFAGEEKRSDGRAWHPICYTCKNPKCHTPLNSSLLAIHKKNIYCKYCHPLLFGPNGYGYGIPAALITEKDWNRASTTSEWQSPGIAKAFIAPLNISPEKSYTTRFSLLDGKKKSDDRFKTLYRQDICSRCNEKIVNGEGILAANTYWHKNCFNCNSCAEKLNIETVYDRQGEIYCGNCMKYVINPQDYTKYSSQNIRKKEERGKYQLSYKNLSWERSEFLY